MVNYSKLKKEYLHECFLYDDGKLYWKERPLEHFTSSKVHKRFNKLWSGRRAGGGHSRVSLDCNSCLCTKIIWRMMKDEPCPESIGYKDFNMKNTNVENLIPTYKGETASSRRIANTGHRRVTKREKTYVVQFPRNGYFKVFQELESAIQDARQKAKIFGYRDII